MKLKKQLHSYNIKLGSREKLKQLSCFLLYSSVFNELIKLIFYRSFKIFILTTLLSQLKSKQKMYSQKMQFVSCSSAKTTTGFLANKRQTNVEKDSGVYDPSTVSYSASRRGSASSSGCPSGYSGVPVTVSPNTTSSSAYSSAASTCSETDVLRRDPAAKSRFESSNTQKMDYNNRVPFHPQLVNHFPSTATDNFERVVRNTAGRFPSSFVKSEYASDNGRKLYDHINNKVYEKKRLLGKVSAFMYVLSSSILITLRLYFCKNNFLFHFFLSKLK